MSYGKCSSPPNAKSHRISARSSPRLPTQPDAHYSGAPAEGEAGRELDPSRLAGVRSLQLLKHLKALERAGLICGKICFSADPAVTEACDLSPLTQRMARALSEITGNKIFCAWTRCWKR